MVKFQGPHPTDSSCPSRTPTPRRPSNPASPSGRPSSRPPGSWPNPSFPVKRNTSAISRPTPRLSTPRRSSALDDRPTPRPPGAFPSSPKPAKALPRSPTPGEKRKHEPSEKIPAPGKRYKPAKDFHIRLENAPRSPTRPGILRTWLLRQNGEIKGVAKEFASGSEIPDAPILEAMKESLDHPNVVRLIDSSKLAGVVRGVPHWTAWEYCDGNPNTLGQLLARMGECGEVEDFVWHVLLELLRAVHWLHHGRKSGKGEHTLPIKTNWRPVIHNAINPDNIFFTKHWAPGVQHPTVKLGNFSKCRLLASRMQLGEHSSVEGFPDPEQKHHHDFHAPEMEWMSTMDPYLLELSKTDPREFETIIRINPPDKNCEPYGGTSDIWSIGAIAVALMGGAPLETGKDEPEGYAQHSKARGFVLKSEDLLLDGRKWTAFNCGPKSYSLELRRSIARMLQFDPKKRIDAQQALDLTFQEWQTWIGKEHEGAKRTGPTKFVSGGTGTGAAKKKPKSVLKTKTPIPGTVPSPGNELRGSLAKKRTDANTDANAATQVQQYDYSSTRQKTKKKIEDKQARTQAQALPAARQQGEQDVEDDDLTVVGLPGEYPSEEEEEEEDRTEDEGLQGETLGQDDEEEEEGTDYYDEEEPDTRHNADIDASYTFDDDDYDDLPTNDDSADDMDTVEGEEEDGPAGGYESPGSKLEFRHEDDDDADRTPPRPSSQPRTLARSSGLARSRLNLDGSRPSSGRASNYIADRSEHDFDHDFVTGEMEAEDEDEGDNSFQMSGGLG